MDDYLSFSQLDGRPSKKALQAFEKDAGWNLSRDERSRVRDSRPRMRWVGVNVDNTLIGIAQLELAPPQFCYVSHLVIKSEFRGKKIGRWFVKSIEKFAFSLGVHCLLLTPQIGSVGFYESLDFVADPYVDGVLKKPIYFSKKMHVR